MAVPSDTKYATCGTRRQGCGCGSWVISRGSALGGVQYQWRFQTNYPHRRHAAGCRLLSLTAQETCRRLRAE